MSIAINNKEDKTYVILGAPHSATSFIAKSLKDQRVNIEVDMKGVYQDKRFVDLNSRLLSRAGGNWHDPPSDEEILAVEDDFRIKRYVNARKDKFWGCKDPRTSFDRKSLLSTPRWRCLFNLLF